MATFNPARRLLIIVCLIALFVATVGIACGPHGCGDTRPMSDPICQQEVNPNNPSLLQQAADQAKTAVQNAEQTSLPPCSQPHGMFEACDPLR